MFAALTGLGLSAAAGLNAWIPFLVVALVARFTDVLTLPPTYSWIESWWAIGIAAVLLLVEVVVDKIPAIDSINDTIQTVIRPSVGGLIFAASTAADDLEQSLTTDHPWLGAVAGIVMALLVHAGKAAARPAVNAGTGGVGAPVVSSVEDGTSIGLSLVAIFLPVLVIVFLAALAWVLFVLVRRTIRWRRRRRERAAAPPGRR